MSTTNSSCISVCFTNSIELEVNENEVGVILEVLSLSIVEELLVLRLLNVDISLKLVDEDSEDSLLKLLVSLLSVLKLELLVSLLEEKLERVDNVLPVLRELLELEELLDSELEVWLVLDSLTVEAELPVLSEDSLLLVLRVLKVDSVLAVDLSETELWLELVLLVDSLELVLDEVLSVETVLPVLAVEALLVLLDEAVDLLEVEELLLSVL